MISRVFKEPPPPFYRLKMVLNRNHMKARNAGRARGPNKIGRHFWPLHPDILDAIRDGVPRDIMRGAAGQQLYRRRKK